MHTNHCLQCSAMQRNGKWERLGPPLRYYRVGEHFDLPETCVVAYRFVGLSHWRQAAAGQMFETMSNWFDGMCNQQTPAPPPYLPTLKWSTTVSGIESESECSPTKAIMLKTKVVPHQGANGDNRSRLVRAVIWLFVGRNRNWRWCLCVPV